MIGRYQTNFGLVAGFKLFISLSQIKFIIFFQDILRVKSESEAWNHFKKIDSEYAECVYCSKKLSTRGSTTSGLLRHLLSRHNISLPRRRNAPWNTHVYVK